MKEAVRKLINADRGGWCIKDLMEISSLAEDKAIIALFSGEKELHGHKCNTVTNVSGRFRRKFQRNADGQYGAGSFYECFGRYNNCIKKGYIDTAKEDAYKTLKAFISGVLMLITLASSSAVSNRDIKVWKDRSKFIREAYDKIVGTDFIEHATNANGLYAELVKNILNFVEKALSASEEATTADEVREAWATEQKSNAIENKETSSIKVYPLKDVLKDLIAAKAKNKATVAKDAQAKAGGKKFKAESVYNKCSTKQGDRK